jgi:hypothetical protein
MINASTAYSCRLRKDRTRFCKACDRKIDSFAKSNYLYWKKETLNSSQKPRNCPCVTGKIHTPSIHSLLITRTITEQQINLKLLRSLTGMTHADLWMDSFSTDMKASVTQSIPQGICMAKQFGNRTRH